MLEDRNGVVVQVRGVRDVEAAGSCVTAVSACTLRLPIPATHLSWHPGMSDPATAALSAPSHGHVLPCVLPCGLARLLASARAVTGVSSEQDERPPHGDMVDIKCLWVGVAGRRAWRS